MDNRREAHCLWWLLDIPKLAMSFMAHGQPRRNALSLMASGLPKRRTVLGGSWTTQKRLCPWWLQGIPKGALFLMAHGQPRNHSVPDGFWTSKKRL